MLLDDDARSWAESIAGAIGFKFRLGPLERDILRNSALVALWRVGGRWEPSRGEFKPYAFVCIRRACWYTIYSEFKPKGKGFTSSLESLVSADGKRTVGQTLAAKAEAESFSDFSSDCERLIASLNFQERLLINRVYFQGWSLERFAKVVGLSSARIGQMHEKAIKKMRGCA